MKKLLFGLIATVMFSFVGNAQSYLKTVSAERAYKFYNVIALLESNTQFEQSKSADDFVKQMTIGVTDSKLIELITPLLKSVYSMHTSKYTQDNAYDKADLLLYSKTFNNVTDYVRNNPKALANLNNQKMGWLNAIRKFIDIIDDLVNPKP